MKKSIWKKESLSVVYSEPSVTPFKEKLLTTFNEVMYFYYSIKILDDQTKLFESRAYDFPKVQNLPLYIEHLLEIEESKMFVYEDLNRDGFHRKVLHYFIVLEDSINMNAEYFYKIEKTITYVKQRDESKSKRFEEYTLTIGQHGRNKEGYSNGESFGQSIFIKYLEKEDLLELKQTALDFCQLALAKYNHNLKQSRVKCPTCYHTQKYIDCLNTETEADCPELTCLKCGNAFSRKD